MVILVGFGSPHPSFFIIERGIKLILAPKSHKALRMSTDPMEQGIVKAFGSFNFGGSFFWRIALQYSKRAMFSSSFGFHHELSVHRHLIKSFAERNIHLKL